MDEFYQTVIADLKNQIADLSDQKASQVALNVLKQKEIVALQEKVKELESKQEAPAE
jgi:polyphosphate kinase